MSLNSDEQNEIMSKLNIILNKDNYIENNVIIYSKNDDKFSYITGDLLLQLISLYSINKEKEIFLIESIFTSKNMSYRLFFYISCYYGLLDKFLEYYLDYGYPSRNFDETTKFLVFFINNSNYFLKYFNQKQLSNLLIILKEHHQYFAINNLNSLLIVSSQIMEEIVNFQFSELSKNLIGINIEINKDKEEVKKIINYFGFDSKYNEFLTDLDKHFYSENKDSIEIAGLIGNFREFSCKLIEDIALEIAKINGLNEVPKNKNANSKIGHARCYLKDMFELNDNENKFIDNFIQILHSEGGHSFLSTIEYFRLTKNILIEIVLLLLYKLRDFKSKIH